MSEVCSLTDIFYWRLHIARISWNRQLHKPQVKTRKQIHNKKSVGKVGFMVYLLTDNIFTGLSSSFGFCALSFTVSYGKTPSKWDPLWPLCAYILRIDHLCSKYPSLHKRVVFHPVIASSSKFRTYDIYRIEKFYL